MESAKYGKEGIFMLKKPFLAIIFGSALLVGCNTGNDESVGDDDGVIEDVGEDIQEGVNEVEKDVDDTIDEPTIDNNDTRLDGDQNSNGAGQNQTAPDINNGDERIINDNDEDIIEDPKDVRDRDTVDE